MPGAEKSVRKLASGRNPLSFRNRGIDVQPDAGAHRRRDGDGLDVRPLRAARTSPTHRVDRGEQIRLDLFLGKARLTDRDMNQVRAVVAEVYTPAAPLV